MTTTDEHHRPELVELRPQLTAVERGHVTEADIGAFLGRAFGEAAESVARGRGAITGPPFARYEVVDGEFDVEAGFPVDTQVVDRDDVHPGRLPGGAAVRVLHVGSYAEVASAYAAAEAWMAEHGYVAAGPAWESYLDGPDEPAPRTLVFAPCAPRPA